MDPIGSGGLQISLRRYGPTVYLALAGELDFEAEPAIARLRTVVLRDDIDVVACDLHRVPFMDVSGLRCLLDLQECAREHGITVIAYNWRPQPLQLLHFLDGLDSGDDIELQALRDLLREHAEAQVNLRIGTARRRPSVLVDAEIRHPGPASPRVAG